jgi:hypothetical protein
LRLVLESSRAMVMPDAPAPTMQMSPSRIVPFGSVLASVCKFSERLCWREREQRGLSGFCH